MDRMNDVCDRSRKRASERESKERKGTYIIFGLFLFCTSLVARSLVDVRLEKGTRTGVSELVVGLERLRPYLLLRVVKLFPLGPQEFADFAYKLR